MEVFYKPPLTIRRQVCCVESPFMARVLGRVRLSRLTDESTSAERQRELIEQWSAMNDHTVVGWAEDLDISGSVTTPSKKTWQVTEICHLNQSPA